ncbi:MAG: thiamine-phosphate kinase [Alphaproteobacteria bacterium]
MSKRGGEFDFIAQHLKPLATHSGARSLADDVALLDPNWVVSKDMLIAGVHFRPDDPADLIARKALRVNLSDLAGKGAVPFGYFLGCAFPNNCDEKWRSAFVNGLDEDQALFGLSLLGGDTVATPGPLTFSVTMVGKLVGRVPARSNAKIGDDIWVSGTLGDAALGLHESRDSFLRQRYLLPQPRIELGKALHGLINASMDVSDGLLADAAHIATASAARLSLDIERLPLSTAVQEIVVRDDSKWQMVVSGGDDYEILFTASPNNRSEIVEAAEQSQTAVSRIGGVVSGTGLTLLGAAAKFIDPSNAGYQHL